MTTTWLRRWRDSAHTWPLSVAIFALVAMLVYGSVMEDAYITLRVVDNIVQGHGLRWNLDDRVQVYTHPLWMMVMVPLFALWPDGYFMTLTLCLICSLSALCLPLYQLRRTILQASAFYVMPLLLSESYLTFSTSGFENPLTHLLFAVFAYVLWHGQGARFWLLASFFTALALVNRLDCATFYAPIWVFLLLHRPQRIRIGQLLLGAVPLVAWILFSVFYYGFVFPNTKYAKLNTWLGQEKYIQLGLHYLLNLAVMDAVSALLILAALFQVPLGWRRYARTRDLHDGVVAAVASGVLSEVLYVVCIGGTYVTGRMLTLAIFASAWVLLARASYWRKEHLHVALLICFAVRASYPDQEWVRKACWRCLDGVEWVRKGDALFLKDVLTGKGKPPVVRSQIDNRRTIVAGSMGMWGYAKDRQCIIIDFIGLTDPLLARLPINRSFLYNMGNLPRDIPPGYEKARATGDLSGMDQDLAAYYEKLRVVVAGDLWSRERLWEIYRINRGDYDHWLAAYAAKNPPKR